LDWIPRINEISVQDDAAALRAALWRETDTRFKDAQEKFIKIQAEQQVKVAESDTSPDFSSSKAVEYLDPLSDNTLVLEPWREKLRAFSSVFKQHPWIYRSQVSLRSTVLTKYQVNSEGSRIREVRTCHRVSIYAATMADDGMELYLSHSFQAFSPEDLPSDSEITSQIDTIIAHLDALRNAPMVEPYTGPAILVNRASGVFFHEIFGHRIEGHRQKSEFEGQTFTKKVGEKILPEFISVFDDPTLKSFNGVDLNGHYRFDDEGVPAKKVMVVEDGILKEFLMSRSPIENFPRSTEEDSMAGMWCHGRACFS
jgi:predicted Zn-dependent protease